MNLKTAAKISVLGAALVLSGCAFVPDNIGNHYHVPKNLSVVPGAENVTVHVTVKNDKKHHDEVSLNKDDLGIAMSGTYIHVKKDFTENIDAALEKRGFKIGESGTDVNVVVKSLWFNVKPGFADVFTHGHGEIIVDIPRANYSHEYEVKKYKNAMFQFVFIGKIGHRTKSANAIMADLVNKMVEDPTFIAALFRAAGQAQPAPGVSIPMIPAQG